MRNSASTKGVTQGPRGCHHPPPTSSPGALSYKQRLDCTFFCEGDRNTSCSSLAFPPRRMALKTGEESLGSFRYGLLCLSSPPQTIQPNHTDTLQGPGKAIKAILVKHFPDLNLCLSFHPVCSTGSTRRHFIHSVE